MKNIYRKETNQEYRFKERIRTNKFFIDLYSKPILAHAVNNPKTFLKIIKEGRIKLPNEHKMPKKTPYMEKFMGIDNCIYFSLGFVYTTSFGYKYNFVFSIDKLKDFEYYSHSVIHQCYLAVANYLYKNDLSYFDKLRKIKKSCNEVVEKYMNSGNNDSKRILFEFWKIEKEAYLWVKKHKDYKKLVKIIKKVEKNSKLKYPESVKDAMKNYDVFKAQEVISRKNIDLLHDEHFLGFYIVGKIPKNIQKVLKKKYSNKILFDGKKIKKIVDVLK